MEAAWSGEITQERLERSLASTPGQARLGLFQRAVSLMACRRGGVSGSWKAARWPLDRDGEGHERSSRLQQASDHPGDVRGGQPLPRPASWRVRRLGNLPPLARQRCRGYDSATGHRTPRRAVRGGKPTASRGTIGLPAVLALVPGGARPTILCRWATRTSSPLPGRLYLSDGAPTGDQSSGAAWRAPRRSLAPADLIPPCTPRLGRGAPGLAMTHSPSGLAGRRPLLRGPPPSGWPTPGGQANRWRTTSSAAAPAWWLAAPRWWRHLRGGHPARGRRAGQSTGWPETGSGGMGRSRGS
jgi:hypothetical protein